MAHHEHQDEDEKTRYHGQRTAKRWGAVLWGSMVGQKQQGSTREVAPRLYGITGNHQVGSLVHFQRPVRGLQEVASMTRWGRRRAMIVPRKFSPFVARQYWRKRWATLHGFRAHCVENDAFESGASRSLQINCNHL